MHWNSNFTNYIYQPCTHVLQQGILATLHMSRYVRDFILLFYVIDATSFCFLVQLLSWSSHSPIFLRREALLFRRTATPPNDRITSRQSWWPAEINCHITPVIKKDRTHCQMEGQHGGDYTQWTCHSQSTVVGHKHRGVYRGFWSHPHTQYGDDINSLDAIHYNDVIMGAIASQITSLTIVFSTVYLDTDQRKHQSSASLAFARGIHRRPVNSPHKWPVTRKMFPLDDVIMSHQKWGLLSQFCACNFVISFNSWYFLQFGIQVLKQNVFSWQLKFKLPNQQIS